MVGRLVKALSITAVMFSVFICGCGEPTDMALNFQQGNTTTYKVYEETAKTYKFEQPSINKVTDKDTVVKSEIIFDQEILSVDEQGNARVQVTIKDLMYYSQNPKGIAMDYDSRRDNNEDKGLDKVLGKTYTFTLTPNGEVTNIDSKQALATTRGGLAGKISGRLLDKDSIKERHEILALAGKNLEGQIISKNNLKPGDTWSVVTASPPGMLQAKSYEKVYTLEKIVTKDDAKIAYVSMQARPSAVRAKDMPEDAGSMGFFANMFDFTDDYSGQLILNLQTGEIISYNEDLMAKWVAAESPEEQKSDKGPDVLTMGFNKLYNIEQVD